MAGQTRQTQAPATEPVTLAEAKMQCRVDHAEEDALISLFIQAAREEVEHRCDRSVIDRQLTLTLDGFPDQIRLHYPRVTSIASLKYYDESGALQTMNPAGYVLDNAGEYANWIAPAPGYAWPNTAQDRFNAVEVVYRAGEGAAVRGYAKVRLWILLTVAFYYDNRAAGVERAIESLPRTFYDGLLDEFKVVGV